MATVTPSAVHVAEDHRLDVSEVRLDATTFAPIYTGMLLDWRCPHGATEFGHLEREAWREAAERATTLEAMWLSLQARCTDCVGRPFPVVGEVVARDG